MRRFFSRRRFAALALSAGLVAAPLATLAPAAEAAGPVSCQFTGTTTSLTPIPVTGSNSGSYSFAGTANCVAASGGVVTGASVSSSGTYANIQCGTGTATGTATIGSGIGSFSYTITFVAGAGTLTSTSAGDTAAGPVDIVPQPGGCVTGPVTQFTVTGEVSGIIT
jgi:hypothetical protein